MQKTFDRICEALDSCLPEKLMKFIRTFLSVQFLTFMIIGVVNTLSTSVIATLLDWLKALTVAPDSGTSLFLTQFRVTFILGYIASLILSFFLNSHFTFHEKPSWKKFITFPLSYIPNFIIQYICVWIFTTLSWNATLAYLLAAIIGTPITFLTMKLIVFHKRPKKHHSERA